MDCEKCGKIIDDQKDIREVNCDFGAVHLVCSECYNNM